MVKRVKRKLILIPVLLLITLMLNSCTTLGPLYQKDTVPDNMGMAYIYRPKKIVGCAVKYKVRVGDTPITTLYNGGYYPYFSKPGEVEF